MSSGSVPKINMTNLAKEAEGRIGETIADRYRLQKVLGVGGMGAVYQALQLYTEQLCALKLLHPSVASSQTAAARFLREAKAASAIKHPAIVDVRDAGHAQNRSLYLVFELLKGFDLGQGIMERRVDVRMTVDIGIQTLEALEVAHKKGFVHRDIKPANLFLVPVPVEKKGEGVQVKLLDFGIAGRIEEQEDRSGLTQAGAVVGTPYYMSPEQMAGERVDGRADLWALGVVLFLCLTGQLPFKAQNYVALMAQMISGDGPRFSALRPDLPPRLRLAIERALAPDLVQRYSNAKEMANALRDCGILSPSPDLAESAEARSPSDVESPTDIIPRKTLGRSGSHETQALGTERTRVLERARADRQTKQIERNKPKEKWEQGLEGIEGEIEALRRKKAPPKEERKSSVWKRLFTGKAPKSK